MDHAKVDAAAHGQEHGEPSQHQQPRASVGVDLLTRELAKGGDVDKIVEVLHRFHRSPKEQRAMWEHLEARAGHPFTLEVHRRYQAAHPPPTRDAARAEAAAHEDRARASGGTFEDSVLAEGLRSPVPSLGGTGIHDDVVTIGGGSRGETVDGVDWSYMATTLAGNKHVPGAGTALNTAYTVGKETIRTLGGVAEGLGGLIAVAQVALQHPEQAGELARKVLDDAAHRQGGINSNLATNLRGVREGTIASLFPDIESYRRFMQKVEGNEGWAVAIYREILARSSAASETTDPTR